MTPSRPYHGRWPDPSVRWPVAVGAVALVALWAWPLFAQSPAAAGKPARPVSLANVEVGFQRGLANLVRPDSFAPVKATIQNRSGELFSGSVQVLGRDRDGERIIYERTGIGLTASEMRDVYLCCFIRPNQQDVTLRLLDQDGRYVDSLAVQVEMIQESEYLVVDISPRALAGPLDTALPSEDPAERLRGRIKVATLPAPRLPPCWYELEAVDVIVCNQPDEVGLQGQDRRLEAVLHWVRQGGLLVLGPGSLQALRGSALWDVLPAVPGEAIELPRGTIQASWLQREIPLELFRESILWKLAAAPGSTVLLSLARSHGGAPIVVRRRVGFGEIVQSAVDLRVLLESKDPTKAGTGTRLKAELLGIRTGDIVPGQGGMYLALDANQPWPSATPAQMIQGGADFRAASTLLATLLMLLTVVYGLLVTVGTWAVLRARRLTQHSWLTFAGVALAGSVAAALLVQSARGIRADVKQRSVIDLDAASGLAHVRTFHGLKMPYDATVPIGLAVGGRNELAPEQLPEVYVRPAGDLRRGMLEQFAVRREYAIQCGEPRLGGVPVRATAKQFESYWAGPIDGTIASSLAFAADTSRLSPGCWIANHTKWDLRDCCLVVTRLSSFNAPQRDGNIVVFPIGALPAGGLYNDFQKFYLVDGQPSAVPDRRYWLSQRTAGWIPSAWPWFGQQQFGRWPTNEEPSRPTSFSEADDLVMMSLLSELPSKQDSSGNVAFQPFTQLPRTGTKWLDLRNVLDGRSALLVGFADVPGPVRLTVNGRAVEPSKAECIVRAVLPVAGTTGR